MALVSFVALMAVVLVGPAIAANPATPQPDLRVTTDRPIDLNSVHVPVPPATPKALEFYRTGIPLWFLGRGLSMAVPFLILVTGLSSRIRRFASNNGQPWVVSVAIYAVLFLAIEFLLNLPFRYYMGFVRLHEYGLSVQSPGRWFADSAKSLAVEMVAAALFLWVPYRLMARSPNRWWLYTGLLILPFACFSALIAPIVIDPLYNDFGPMKDKRLEARIDALAHRAGIDGGKIFEVDKSRDTKTVNAYVTGLFGTKRIVLWDTLLTKLDEDEVLVVMGHEMGHYALNHVLQGLVLSSLGSILALYLIHRAANALIGRFGHRFDVRELSDVASAPLILFLAQITMFFGSPLINGMSRHLEHEADRFALEITQTNHAAALGFAKLQEDNLSVPYPDWLLTAWRSTHPPIGERIEFCNKYRPWETGEPLRYGSYFRNP
jgi:Zn-dependent protease with chaperone function